MGWIIPIVFRLPSFVSRLNRQRQPDTAPEQRYHMAELNVEEVVIE